MITEKILKALAKLQPVDYWTLAKAIGEDPNRTSAAIKALIKRDLVHANPPTYNEPWRRYRLGPDPLKELTQEQK